MLALCLILSETYHAKNYAGIILLGVPFGNWSERYIQISTLTSFGKSFNMAYGI